MPATTPTGAKPRASSRTHWVRSPKQVQALISPVRQEIIDAAATMGPFSASEMGEVLGRPADSLYYHLKKLLSVDLLLEVDQRATNGRPEAVYRTPGRDIAIDHNAPNLNRKGAIERLAGAMMRMTLRQYVRAYRRPDAVRMGSDRNVRMGRAKGWLTKREVRAVNEHLEAVTEIVQSSSRRRNTSLHAVTFALVSIDPTERDEGDDE